MSERDAEGAFGPTAGQDSCLPRRPPWRTASAPVTGCSERLLDRVMGASEDELVDLLENAAESA